MIVHIVSDEKFIDAAFRNFEAVAPGGNLFLCRNRSGLPKYVTKTPLKMVSRRRRMESLRLPECKAVIFHSLHPSDAYLIDAVPEGTPIGWIGWGHDYYDLLLRKAFPRGFVLPATLEVQMMVRRRINFENVVSAMKPFIKRLVGRAVVDMGRLQRIAVFCPVLRSEFDMIIRENPQFRPRYVRWNYGVHTNDAIGESGVRPLGADILIGNSSTPANNHIDVFQWLKSTTSLEGRRLIVPLSYGEMQYRNEVLRIGSAMFGEAFHPLLQWMNKGDYEDLMRQCGTAVFGHLRQQGAGNLSMLMRQGAKIFMHSSNILYRQRVSEGAVLFPFDTLATRNEGVDFTPLSDDEKSRNIAISCVPGADVYFQRTRSLMEHLMEQRDEYGAHQD